MNQLRASVATVTTVAVLAAPVMALIWGGLRLRSRGDLNNLDTTGALARLWVLAAVVLALLAVARLFAGSLIDVRSRGLGAVASVSPLRLTSLAIAERSHFAAGPGPEQPTIADPRLGIARLSEWTTSIRTPDFAAADAAKPKRPETSVASPEPNKLRSLTMVVTEEVEAPVYEGPTDVITATRGMTWWTLATKTLDAGERWPEIAAMNVGRTQPDGVVMTAASRIRPGYELTVPAEPESSEA